MKTVNLDCCRPCDPFQSVDEDDESDHAILFVHQNVRNIFMSPLALKIRDIRIPHVSPASALPENGNLKSLAVAKFFLTNLHLSEEDALELKLILTSNAKWIGKDALHRWAVNAIAGPGFQRLNLPLFENFTTIHVQHISFRADCFNVLNHPTFSSPPTTNLPSTAGAIATDLHLHTVTPAARIFHLSAKCIFQCLASGRWGMASAVPRCRSGER